MLSIDSATEEELRSVIQWIDTHPVINDHIMVELKAYVLQDETFHFLSVERMLTHFDYVENNEGSYG